MPKKNKINPSKFVQVSIDKNVPYFPTRKKRVFNENKRVNWPFLAMNNGDSFLIPKGYTLARCSGAFNKAKRDHHLELAGFVLRSQEEGDRIRVWLFNQDGARYPAD